MKIHKYKQKHQSPGWSLTFLSGIILGGFVVWWNKDVFLMDSYFLGEEVFKRFGYTSIYKEGFFYYILKNRIEFFVLLILSSFTSLMNLFFYIIFLWCGVSIGVITVTLIIKFGIKGIVLLFGLLFPHMFIYVPCFLGLIGFLHKLKNAEKNLYPEFNVSGNAGNKVLSVFLLMILGFGLVLFLGVLLESYVNPLILKKITNLFW